MTVRPLFQVDDLPEVQVKAEPDEDVENESLESLESLHVLRKLSVTLTDCRLWLKGRDFLSLGKAA